MRHWFKDQAFRSLIKNTSYLAMSRVVAAIASLATLALAGRELGLEKLGLLLLIASYAQAVCGLTKFQTWQIVVRYGAKVIYGEDVDRFKAATGFALALDVVTGIGAMVAAIALLPALGSWFGLPDDLLLPSMLYCLLIPTMSAATPNGVIRALDRFDLLSWQSTVTPILRCMLAVPAFIFHWPLVTWLAIWWVTDVVGDLYIWYLAWREMKRRDVAHGIKPTLKPTALPGVWPFAININLTSSLMSAWGPVARLLVGGLLGPAAAALYRIASSLADSAQKPADLLARAYYPEVQRMDHSTKHPWRLMKRAMIASSIFGGTAILIMLLGGEWLIETVFTDEFSGAYAPLLIMLGVPLLTIISFPLPSTLYALDRPDAPLKARIVATLTYLAIIVPLCRVMDLNGAALAYLLANAVLVICLGLYVRAGFHRVRVKKAAS